MGTDEKPAGGIKEFARRALVEPLAKPTSKQKEAYARFLHTLSAAAFIGGSTVAYGGVSWADALRAVLLFLIGAVLFLGAAFLAKGD